jgi:non-reducing end alpha-L-arabinofuranosidase
MATGGAGSGGLPRGTGGTANNTGGITSSGTGRGGAGGTGGTGGSSSSDAGGSGGSSTSGTGASRQGPCDIYESGGTPCVAAHSTTRALFAAYSGKLYQVRRADKALQDIGVLSPGGIADASTQETFCANSKCTISKIYDQSPKQNDLTLTSGGWIGDRAKEVDAFGVKSALNGMTVYGIHITGETNMTGNGYRNNAAVGTAQKDEPESMYMVANGKNFNADCCFDYGNAETNSLNNGAATMEAIYFGNCTAWGSGEGTGPWVMADLEEGLFSGRNPKLNAGVKSMTSDYVTAMLKGKAHTMAIKAGDAQSGPLTTVYEGAYPNGYDPMKKEGAIVLGTGGDNSFAAVGDFFEGAMTAGYATDATDAAVQANIVAAGYGR